MSATASAPTAVHSSALACLFNQCIATDIDDVALKAFYSDVGPWPEADQVPIVYHWFYNITFFGFEKLHPFDSCKYRKIVVNLEKANVVSYKQTIQPVEVTDEVLLDVHTPEYLQKLHKTNWKIVQVIEMPSLVLMPHVLLYRQVVLPLRYHTAGTILATGLALKYGWAINLGGGMHHAHSSDGQGWCCYDDIMLAVRRVRLATGNKVKRVLYVDLDAHQGNGVARDKLTFKDEHLFILDMYNSRIFPRDFEAKPAIDVNVELVSGTEDESYLRQLGQALAAAATRFPNPDLVFFNAGTDIHTGDKLGRLQVSPAGVIARDELVWRHALQQRAPIIMTLSGGYTSEGTTTITKSLTNLIRQFNLVPGPPQQPSSSASDARPTHTPQDTPTQSLPPLAHAVAPAASQQPL